ncbi:Zinc phosphodiesterase [Entamoeba marina]
MDCIIPLGNCAGWTTLHSNTTSNLIRLNDGNYIVIDCGSGIFYEAIHTTNDISKIIALYVTHLHIDHVADIIAFADSRFLPVEFKIYGPKGIKEIIAGFEKYNGGHSPYHNSVIELDDQVQFPHQLQLYTLPNGTHVSSFRIPHSEMLCYGYLFEDINGLRVCHLGDTSGIDLSPLGKIHILIHEATCGVEKSTYSHSNGEGAARCADGVNADFLLLTHFSSTIEEEDPILEIRKFTQQFTNANVWTLFYKEPFIIKKYYPIGN